MKLNINKELLKDFVSRFNFNRDSASDEENSADSVFECESEEAERTINQFRRSKRDKGVITDDIVINGSIISGSNLVIEDVVNGDITDSSISITQNALIDGKLNITKK